jgi:hypothetical protein
MPRAARRRGSSSSRVARSAPIPLVAGDLNLAISAAVSGIFWFDPENGHRSSEKRSPNKRLSVPSRRTKMASAGERNSPGSGSAEEFGNRSTSSRVFRATEPLTFLQPKNHRCFLALVACRQDEHAVPGRIGEGCRRQPSPGPSARSRVAMLRCSCRPRTAATRGRLPIVEPAPKGRKEGRVAPPSPPLLFPAATGNSG